MNWDIVQGNWLQLKGSVQEKWADLTDDDIQKLDGKKDQLAGKLQERYGIARDEAEKQIDEWADKLKDVAKR